MLNKLFGGGAADLVKSVGGVIDNLHTSKEEKLEAEKQIKDMIMGYEAEMPKQPSTTNTKESYTNSLITRSLPV